MAVELDAKGNAIDTGSSEVLADWVGDYATDMLAEGKAAVDAGYEAYTGPLTAGVSDTQTAAFEGVAGLTMPTDTEMGAFNPQTFTADNAQQYMNPYLDAALQPQIDAAVRDSEIQRLKNNSRLTQAGAYGGSRQAIMESEGNRNLYDRVGALRSTGYADAYDKAMSQFNTEQSAGQTANTANNIYGLDALRLQGDLGAEERAITAEGVLADKAQFEEERDYDFLTTQFLSSLLQGLPTSASQTDFEIPSQLDLATMTASDFEAWAKNFTGDQVGEIIEDVTNGATTENNGVTS